MNATKWMWAACAAVAMAGGAGQVAAQSDDAAPLGGPKIDGAAKRPATLVERDFDGKLKRLDDPVLAAVELLKLAPADRAAVEEVMNARAAAIDELVRDHLREIAELAGARQAGEQARARELLRDLLGKAKPIMEKGSLVEQVRVALPGEAREEFKRLVDDYTQASMEERRESGGEEGRRAGRGRGRLGKQIESQVAERLIGFGQEVKRSYERVFGNRAKDFQEMLKDLNLTPEQEAKVQRIFTDLFQKTYGKPTRTQSTKAFLEAYALMNDEQRGKFREMVAARQGRGKGNVGAEGTSKPAPETVPTPKPDEMQTK